MIPKFRAYDLNEKEWIDIRYIGLSDDGSLWYVQAWDECERDIDPPYFEEDLGKTWALMQSTGLLDKNGKEIFEGDIIDKGYSNIDIVDRIGYVKFGTGDDSDGYLNQEWLGWTTNNDDSLLDVHEHCTVLGNRFEHPHLLEEE